MKKCILLLVLLQSAYYIQAQTSDNQKGIVVKPAVLEFSAALGSMQTKKIFITNNLPQPSQFTIYTNDWLRDTLGGHVYTDPSLGPRSCATWVRPEKDFVELQPGESKSIEINLKYPADAGLSDNMRWCMLFVETTKEKMINDTKGFRTTISNHFRVGVHIYQTPPGVTTKEIQLEKISLLSSDSNSYRIICKNKGGVQLQCSSYLELSSLADGSSMRLPSKDFPIFPDQTRYVDFTLPASLAKGKYTLTGIVDAGIDVPLEAAQLIIEIK